MSQRNKPMTDDERLDAIAETKFWRSPFILKAAHLVISTCIAAIVTVWAVRGYVADRDLELAKKLNEITNGFNSRFAAIDMELATARTERETLRLKVDKEIVPRAEHEAYWKQTREWQAEMRQDMREVRADIKTLMSKTASAPAGYQNDSRTASR